MLRKLKLCALLAAVACLGGMNNTAFAGPHKVAYGPAFVRPVRPVPVTVIGVDSLGQTVTLNPQPLPPRMILWRVPTPGGPVMLNPQPLPPRVSLWGTPIPGGPVMLNPQPLPPRIVLPNGGFAR